MVAGSTFLDTLAVSKAKLHAMVDSKKIIPSAVSNFLFEEILMYYTWQQFTFSAIDVCDDVSVSQDAVVLYLRHARVYGAFHAEGPLRLLFNVLISSITLV